MKFRPSVATIVDKTLGTPISKRRVSSSYLLEVKKEDLTLLRVFSHSGGFCDTFQAIEATKKMIGDI